MIVLSLKAKFPLFLGYHCSSGNDWIVGDVLCG